VGISILVFVGLCLVSFAYGISANGEFNTAFSTLKNYAIYSIMFFLVINIIRTKVQIKRFTYIFIASGVALIFFVLYGLVQGVGLWIEFTPLSTSGTRLLAPTHAFYLAVSVLILLNFIAFKRRLFGNLTILIVLLQLIGVVGALTRHIWIAIALAIFISFILLSRKNKKSLLKIVAIQLFLVIMVVSLYVWFDYLVSGQFPEYVEEFYQTTIVRIQSLTLSLEDESSAFRLLAWQEAWETFSDNPILGIGFGHRLTFDFFGYPTRIDIRDLHNDFVGIALQMGILGFIGFGSVQVLFIHNFFKTFARYKVFKPILLGFFASYILFMVSANFGVYLDINLLAIFYWMFMGIIITTSYTRIKKLKK